MCTEHVMDCQAFGAHLPAAFQERCSKIGLGSLLVRAEDQHASWRRTLLDIFDVILMLITIITILWVSLWVSGIMSVLRPTPDLTRGEMHVFKTGWRFIRTPCRPDVRGWR